MPKPIPATILDAICDRVRQFPGGALLAELEESFIPAIPRRTLQRHLAYLVQQGRLAAEGETRSRRYHAAEPTAPEIPSFVVKEEPEIDAVPASPKGIAIRSAVRAPIQKRHPVGYNRAWLDAYRPNETFYLSAKARQRLAALGQSPGGERPAGTYIRQIYHRLLIDLAWNSSRLEGNTYSLLETARLLDLGESAEGKNAQEAQMILNHKAAIELLVEQADEVGFNRYTILNLHALLSDNLLSDPMACGRLRSRAVGVSGTVFHPLEVPQLIEESFQQILDTAAAIHDPFEQAFFAMVHLPYLQPFEDVNKRVSRLAANIPMIRRNLCPLSFVDVPDRDYIDGILGVYELNRTELLGDVFVWAYERSCARYQAVRASLGEPDPFRLRYRQSIQEAVSAIVRQHSTQEEAAAHARDYATKLPAEDRPRFIDTVATELRSLHEGNIARYRLRPSEYQSWMEVWAGAR